MDRYLTPGAEHDAKKQERFEGSVHALAIVALAGELYPAEERRRLLSEYRTLRADRAAAIEANQPREQLKTLYDAMKAFEAAHPLIAEMDSKIESLTGRLLG